MIATWEQGKTEAERKPDVQYINGFQTVGMTGRVRYADDIKDFGNITFPFHLTRTADGRWKLVEEK